MEISLKPIHSSFSKPSYTSVSNFGLSSPKTLTPKIQKEINEFCESIGNQTIDRSNCFKAVGEVIGILSKRAPKNSSCTLSYFGYQLIQAKEYNAPLSKTVTCCPWRTDYYQICTTARYQKICGHCSLTNGQYLVLKYKPLLTEAIKNLKCALDKGCVVKAGVLSGICDDKPDIGCAKRLTDKRTVWRDCPEHWILIIGYDGDTFFFWDSSRASSMSICGHEFGLLHYNKSENRLSTALIAGNLDTTEVNPSGFHVFDDQQKRYQVLTLLIGGSYRESTGAC